MAKISYCDGEEVGMVRATVTFNPREVRALTRAAAMAGKSMADFVKQELASRIEAAIEEEEREQA